MKLRIQILFLISNLNNWYIERRSHSGKQRLIQGESNGKYNTRSDDQSKDKTEIISEVSEEKYAMSEYDWLFLNKRMNEEETQIGRLIMLEVSYFKRIIIVPLLWIFTWFVILLFWFWSVNLKRALFFNKTNKIENATHLLVYGIKKHIEIVPITSGIILELTLKHTYLLVKLIIAMSL